MVEINKVVIPPIFQERMKGLGPHLIRISRQSKTPVDKDWTNPEKQMETNDDRLLKWLNDGNNYGVAAGGGLVILDADDTELNLLILSKLPETFTVSTPGHNGFHYYYFCDLERAIRLRDKNGQSLGDIQGIGKQVLGPGSIHPNRQIYTIKKELIRN